MTLVNIYLCILTFSEKIFYLELVRVVKNGSCNIGMKLNNLKKNHTDNK